MRESPAIKVNRNNLQTDPGSALAYAAALFKGTMAQIPGVSLRLAGIGMVAQMASERLTRTLGVPASRIVLAPMESAQSADDVKISILYPQTKPPGTRSTWISFKLDTEAIPIEIEFDVSPDGAYVEEAKAKLEWDKLKVSIKKQAFGGTVEKVKVSVKVEGIASFDRERSTKVETALKAKIKSVLSANIKVPGTQKPIMVELVGALFSKYEDGKTKAGGEGILQLTIPFDFL